ncbi:atlastin isoform X2 [Plutella xylostella]|uniref:atlastin isoform X2 n=1 Tax=Plutella xylostella TaxID=51655 RepID=UPI0020331588|nr:atlastin isoform X2 [Plutella xylostella]
MTGGADRSLEPEQAVVGKLSLRFQANDIVIEDLTEKESPSRSGPYGVQIVNTGPDHTFVLDEDALADLLLRDDVKDRAVVVISVVGAFRKGKSFLLDFFLRYMQHKYGSGGGGDWLGSEDAPLRGFSWRGGSERDTTGILMWSEVFKTTLENGEKVAIVLLDTQGAFDSESTVRDNATVFALSTMLSSTQIYNLSQNIQEDDLQHLQLFTEYGRLALEASGTTPFQRLQFLVRDWSFPYEAPYGAEGGREILQRRLKTSDNKHPELQSLRQHITSCFSEIACFLMPHPGLRVATSPAFDGRLQDIEPEFKRSLQQLVPMLLSPQALVPKLINGQKVTCRDLLQYFKSYMNIYKGNELPEPKSMLAATAEANNLTAVAEAKEVYTRLMEEICGGAKPYLQSAMLEAEHHRVRDKALHAFQSKRKMGGDVISEGYCKQLTQDLEEQFAQFAAHNESKNIFKAARTPSVYFTIAMVFYVLSGACALLGLYALANLCNMAMFVALLTLVLWAYIRYSGEMRELGVTIDDAANMLWDNVMKPMYQACLEKSLEHAAAAAAERALGPPTANGKHKQL